MVELDLSELPTDLIRSTLNEFVEKRLNTKDYKIHLSSASKAENAIANEQDSTGKVIIKVAPQNMTTRNAFKTRPAFLREIFVFEEVLPYFREFQQSKGIVIEEDGFVEHPECYRTIDVEPSESVFLEDLSNRNFSIVDRYTKDISAEHVRLVMEALGKFHAVSFALKDQQPEKFKELSSNLPESFIGNDEPAVIQYFKKTMEDVLDVISSDEDATLRARYKQFLEKDPNDVLVECVDPLSAEPATVISHGDAWQNNIMCRYEDNKNPIDICLLDWQITRHSSPIIDLVYFLFSCTTKELRDAHYDDFLKIYHESLSAHIRKLGSDPDQLFPYQLMLEHFRKFAQFGLIMAVQLLPMITNEKGKTVDLEGVSAKLESGGEFEESLFFIGQSKEKYNKRMRDVIIDMVRLEYI